jgi:hypothetical protein
MLVSRMPALTPGPHTLRGDGVLWKNMLLAVALTSLAGAAFAAESETFTGTAARSSTYKRPLLIVDGKRYEFKASDKADASVAEMLAKFSQGDTGTNVVTGTRATRDKPSAITSPGNCWPTTPSLNPGANAPIVVDASKFPQWKTMVFYDGAKKLGEITQGTATQFTATNLTPGYHVFSVLANYAAGAVRTSDPALVVVRPL